MSVTGTRQHSPPRHAIDEAHLHVVQQAELSRTSWGAIFAGAISGLAIYLILGMVGLAAGIGVVDPAEEANPLAGVPTGVGLWWVISALAAFFAAGLIAGRLAGWPKNTTGALHGLTVGALTLLFVSYVATSTIGSTVSGAAGAVTSLFGSSERQNVLIRVKQPQGAGGSGGINRSQVRSMIDASVGAGAGAAMGAASGDSGQSASANNGGNRNQASASGSSSSGNYFVAGLLLQEAMSSIRQEGREIFGKLVSDAEQRRVGNQLEATYADLLETPGDAGRDVEELFNFLLSNDGVLGPQDRQRAKRLLMNRLGVEKGQADKILSRWEDRYQEAVDNLQNLVNSAGQQLSRYSGETGQRLRGEAKEAASELRNEANDAASAASDEVQEAASAVREGISTAADTVQNKAQEASSAFRKVADRGQRERTAEIAQAAYRDIVNSPGDALSDLQLMFDRLFGNNGVWTEKDLQEVRTLLGEQTGLREEDVNRLIERWQDRYQEAVQRVEASYETVEQETAEVADQTLDTLAATAGWTSLALFLALAASTVGGMLGRPDEDEVVAAATGADRDDLIDDDDEV